MIRSFIRIVWAYILELNLYYYEIYIGHIRTIVLNKKCKVAESAKPMVTVEWLLTILLRHLVDHYKKINSTKFNFLHHHKKMKRKNFVTKTVHSSRKLNKLVAFFVEIAGISRWRYGIKKKTVRLFRNFII